MGGEQNATGNEEAQVNWHQASKKQSPRRGRRDASVERSLTEAMEAHQKALATAAALEEEIEWAEPWHHQELVRGMSLFQKQGLL